MRPLRPCLPLWNSTATVRTDRSQIKIEDCNPGYPRFTALIAAYDPFFLCRQFNKLRARVLLLKQDRLSVLEQKLDEIDRQEKCPLFLGKSRCDRNADRKSILLDIESCLADYDKFAERTHRILSLSHAKKRDVQSLQNWLKGTGCLAKEETEYLTHYEELVSLALASDSALVQLETWVEDKLIRFCRGVRSWDRYNEISSDSNVYIYSGPLIKQIAKVLLLSLITFILLIPVIICNTVRTISIRMVIILLSTVSFLIILSGLTKSRTMELTLAAATYATTLIVFVSGNSATELGTTRVQ